MRTRIRGVVAASSLTSLLAVVPSTAWAAEWCSPIPLESLNTPGFNDNGPEPSLNERILYFSSNRPGGDGQGDLYASRRESRDDGWGPPVNLDGGADREQGVNTRFIDQAPALWNGGHVLFFASDRPTPEGGGAGYGCGPAATSVEGRSCDIWVAEREHTQDDRAWGTPWNLGEPVNHSACAEGMGDLFHDEGTGTTELYFLSNRPCLENDRDYDIFVSEMEADGTFGPPRLVENVNSPQEDQRVTITANGLVMMFQSNRPGGSGSSDIWMSTRDGTDEEWGTPVNLGPPINTDQFQGGPRLSANGKTLYFFSGVAPDLDLYVGRRASAHGTCDK